LPSIEEIDDSVAGTPAKPWCWIKSSFVDLDGWQNGWFWFVWSGF
jgi:hypothetical protein